MPNPKLGTVTMDLQKAISEVKAGKVEYRTDKAGNVHVSIGKASFDAEKLQQNFQALIDTLIRVRPVHPLHHGRIHDGPGRAGSAWLILRRSSRLRSRTIEYLGCRQQV